MIGIEEAIANERPITFRPAFATAANGLIAAVLLGWVWDVGTVADDLDAWIPVHPECIQEKIGLSYDEQKTARRKLTHRKLIQERIIGETLHLRLNVAEIELAIAHVLRAQARRESPENE